MDECNNMIQRHQKCAAGSDCTAPYYVTTKKPLTVREFLDYIIKEYPGEWGSIHIGTIDGKSVSCSSYAKSNHSTGYSHGTMNCVSTGCSKDPIEGMDEDILDMTITSANATGGWTAMDYYLNVRSKNDPKEYITFYIEGKKYEHICLVTGSYPFFLQIWDEQEGAIDDNNFTMHSTMPLWAPYLAVVNTKDYDWAETFIKGLGIGKKTETIINSGNHDYPVYEFDPKKIAKYHTRIM